MSLTHIILIAIPVLFAITLHEVAHGRMALLLGDSTAAEQGRLSLNPLRHIDLVGTVLVPVLMYLMTSFLFGWAKPVPVDWQRLRHPNRDMALVAIAGPAANLLMAIAWLVFLNLLVTVLHVPSASPLISMCQAGIIINIFMLVLNLIPIPPLDGSRILAALLSPTLRQAYARIEPWGLAILVLLLVSGVLTRLFSAVLESLPGTH